MPIMMLGQIKDSHRMNRYLTVYLPSFHLGFLFFELFIGLGQDLRFFVYNQEDQPLVILEQWKKNLFNSKYSNPY